MGFHALQERLNFQNVGVENYARTRKYSPPPKK